MIPSQITVNPSQSSSSRTKGRLIVIVPGCLTDPARLARWVSQLASRRSKDILFLTLSDKSDDALTLNRQQVTLGIVARQIFVAVDTQTIPSANWLDTIHLICTPQDEWVCLTEHIVSTGRFQKRPLASVLGQRFTLPVITLTGFIEPASRQPHPVRRAVFAWAGSFLILGLFLALEINTAQFLQGVTGQILLILAILVEGYLLLAWNNWIG